MKNLFLRFGDIRFFPKGICRKAAWPGLQIFLIHNSIITRIRIALAVVFFFMSFASGFAQQGEAANSQRPLKDSLFIGIPGCSLTEFTELKNVLSAMPDAKMLYACEEEKRFMLLIKRTTYPDIASIQTKIKTVNNKLVVYEKTGGWNSFFSVCKGEIEKNK